MNAEKIKCDDDTISQYLCDSPPKVQKNEQRSVHYQHVTHLLKYKNDPKSSNKMR